MSAAATVTTAAELDEINTGDHVAKTLRISRKHWANLVRAGLAPQPAYVGERSPRWTRRSILDWLDAGGTGAPQESSAEA